MAAQITAKFPAVVLGGIPARRRASRYSFSANIPVREYRSPRSATPSLPTGARPDRCCCPPAGIGRHNAGFPWTREFSSSGPGHCRIYLFQTATCRNFPGAATGKSAGPNRERLRPNRDAAHHGTFSGVNRNAVCQAIAAILAAFKPGPRETSGNFPPAKPHYRYPNPRVTQWSHDKIP